MNSTKVQNPRRNSYAGIHYTSVVCILLSKHTPEKGAGKKQQKKSEVLDCIPSPTEGSSVAMAIYYMSMINKFSQGENKLFNNIITGK